MRTADLEENASTLPQIDFRRTVAWSTRLKALVSVESLAVTPNPLEAEVL